MTLLKLSSGEVYSEFSTQMTKMRRSKSKDADNALGQKCDGLIMSSAHKGVECGRFEYSGGLSEKKDNSRGYTCGREMLDALARHDTFGTATYNEFRRLKILFGHTYRKGYSRSVVHELGEHQPFISLLVARGVYRMILIDRVRIPKDWSSKADTIPLLDLFWTMRGHVRETCDVLQFISNESKICRSKSIKMKKLLPTHTLASPEKPGTGKAARAILLKNGYSSDNSDCFVYIDYDIAED
ncbi:hypothetical protein HK096_006050 [Nowakowskiella sp. JEL0078]|nr:hypothetical protein HK096_006050 [Nowakowskiella sp. JEL0078]